MSEDFAFDGIAETIRTQDGAMTSHPYFVVFEGNPNVASRHWRFVHAFLTRAAAERYIDGRRHDLRRPFVWVASAHDNYEVRAARAAFDEIARLRALLAEADIAYIDRAEALPIWPKCKDEWMVVLSVSDEEVIDNKGGIVAVYRDGECGLRPGEGRKVAERAARTINAAIRNAVRMDRKERGK